MKRATCEAIIEKHPSWTARQIAKESGCSMSWAAYLKQVYICSLIGKIPESYKQQIARIGIATLAKIKSQTARVAEGKDVLASKDFALFLQQSGLEDLLLSENIDLRKPAYELLEECHQQLKNNGRDARFDKGQLQSLHEKLEKLTHLVELQKKAA